MRILILENPEVISTTSKAKKYLQKNSQFKIRFQDNSNSRKTIQKAYRCGVKHFILSLTSDEIFPLLNLIKKLKDAKFVCTSSTVTSLRGRLNNLYFSLASNIYINYIAAGFLTPLACLVYQDEEDPFVNEVIQIFQTFKNFKNQIFSSTDLGWQQFPILLLVAPNSQIYAQINNNVLPTINYSLFGIDIFVEDDLKFSPNIVANNTFLPKSTGTIQQNTYWNQLTRNINFNKSNTVYGAYPLLTNMRWEILKRDSLISTSFQNNGIYISRDLRLYDIDLTFTKKNKNIYHKFPYIWIIHPDYLTQTYRNNLEIISETNPNIKKFVVTKNIKKKVKKYWKKGYRTFILDAPSQQIKRVQMCKFKHGLFICPRATDPTLRTSGSEYIFGLANDNEMIQTQIVSRNRATQNNTSVILGTSENVNIQEFKTELDRFSIKNINFSDIAQLNTQTIVCYVIGTDSEYSAGLNFINTNQDKYPRLGSFIRYNDYITETQVDPLNKSFCTINYTSAQPFLESDYSTLSRPYYLDDSTTFLYLPNILLNIEPQTLFKFGYLTDL